MSQEYKIILRPHQSEKSSAQQESANQYTVEVADSANKVEIKRAIEKIFKVKVESVKTLNVRGKIKRRGNHLHKRNNWKKAIVRVAAGQEVNFFEGVV